MPTPLRGAARFPAGAGPRPVSLRCWRNVDVSIATAFAACCFQKVTGAAPLSVPDWSFHGDSNTDLLLRRQRLYPVELWKHEGQILDEHDLPVVGDKRRALAALAVECLKQRRQQIVEVGAARRTDDGRRQLDIVYKRRRYLCLAAGIPKCTAILLQHGLMAAAMRSAVDEETQQRRRLVGSYSAMTRMVSPSCGARSGDRTPSSDAYEASAVRSGSTRAIWSGWLDTIQRPPVSEPALFL